MRTLILIKSLNSLQWALFFFALAVACKAILLILLIVQSCKSTPKHRGEVEVMGCTYRPINYYNAPALQHSDSCTAPAHPFSEIITAQEFIEGKY